MDDPRSFRPLRIHFAIRRMSACRVLGYLFRLMRSLGRPDHGPMAIDDEGAAPNQRSRGRGSRELCSRLARGLRLRRRVGNIGAASIENAGAKSIVERHEPATRREHEPTHTPQTSSWQAPPSVTSMSRPPPYPVLEKAAAATANAYRYEPISLFVISLTDPSQDARRPPTSDGEHA